MSEFTKPCSDANCSYNSIEDCIQCVKDGTAKCAIWSVIKDILRRLEALEGN